MTRQAPSLHSSRAQSRASRRARIVGGWEPNSWWPRPAQPSSDADAPALAARHAPDSAARHCCSSCCSRHTSCSLAVICVAVEKRKTHRQHITTRLASLGFLGDVSRSPAIEHLWKWRQKSIDFKISDENQSVTEKSNMNRNCFRFRSKRKATWTRSTWSCSLWYSSSTRRRCSFSRSRAASARSRSVVSMALRLRT